MGWDLPGGDGGCQAGTRGRGCGIEGTRDLPGPDHRREAQCAYPAVRPGGWRGGGTCPAMTVGVGRVGVGYPAVSAEWGADTAYPARTAGARRAIEDRAHPAMRVGVWACRLVRAVLPGGERERGDVG